MRNAAGACGGSGEFAGILAGARVPNSCPYRPQPGPAWPGPGPAPALGGFGGATGPVQLGPSPGGWEEGAGPAQPSSGTAQVGGGGGPSLAQARPRKAGGREERDYKNGSHRRRAGSHRRPGKWGEEKNYIPNMAATGSELAATGAERQRVNFNQVNSCITLRHRIRRKK